MTFERLSGYFLMAATLCSGVAVVCTQSAACCVLSVAMLAAFLAYLYFYSDYREVHALKDKVGKLERELRDVVSSVGLSITR